MSFKCKQLSVKDQGLGTMSYYDRYRDVAIYKFSYGNLRDTWIF